MEDENNVRKASFSSDDNFSRKKTAEKIIRLFEEGVDVSPMIIDGNWGVGKTEFCLKTIELSNRQDLKKFASIYFDAFKADHTDDALGALLSVIAKSLNPKFRVKLLDAALPVLGFTLKTAGKAAIGYVAKQNADVMIDGVLEILQSESNSVIDRIADNVIKSHMEADGKIQALQNCLAEVAKNCPLVIFIDELDRCKPSFALSILEIIKHIFDVEGVNFVLVTNAKQLTAAINHCYGQHVDGSKYLSKFFKYRLQLSELVPDRGDSYAATIHMGNLLVGSKYRESIAVLSSGMLKQFCDELIIGNQLSLREVERFVLHLELLSLFSPSSIQNLSLIDNLMRIFGVFLTCFYPEAAKGVSRGRYELEFLAKILSTDLPKKSADIKAHNELGSASQIVLMCIAMSQPNKERFFSGTQGDIDKLIGDFLEGIGMPQRLYPNYLRFLPALEVSTRDLML